MSDNKIKSKPCSNCKNINPGKGPYCTHCGSIRNQCKFFQKGDCKYGDKCQYLHIPKKDKIKQYQSDNNDKINQSHRQNKQYPSQKPSSPYNNCNSNYHYSMNNYNGFYDANGTVNENRTNNYYGPDCSAYVQSQQFSAQQFSPLPNAYKSFNSGYWVPSQYPVDQRYFMNSDRNVDDDKKVKIKKNNSSQKNQKNGHKKTSNDKNDIDVSSDAKHSLQCRNVDCKLYSKEIKNAVSENKCKICKSPLVEKSFIEKVLQFLKK